MVETEFLEQLKKREQSNIERLRAPEGYLYAGLPWFKGLYGRDALIAGWQLLQRDPSIARDTLRFLAGHQGKKINNITDEEPGRILHIYDYAPTNILLRLLRLAHHWLHALPYYGCIDATSLFVLVAAEYLQTTGDRQLIEEIWPNIENAIGWQVKYGDLDGDGFIEYQRKNPFAVRNQNWKDSLPYMDIKLPVAAVEVQGYAYDAYRGAARMARELGKECYDWEERADRLKQDFNQQFWMDDLGFCALALDGDKKPVREIASNPGHLLFTGIIDKDKEKRVVERLFKEDMFTPYGIRSHSSLSRYFDRRIPHMGPCWPHDNWIIRLGLARQGYVDAAKKIDDTIFRTYQELGSLPEFIDEVDGELVIPRSYKKFLWWLVPFRGPCNPQAWSSGAILNIADKSG